ncbi:transposase IS4 [Nitzschia inconspicua]|uniref:Transposase IS4 n=1 Tax=Nitzschia inconspicua TaxID=303405 RepID=A0A9K3PTH1_9STRA|nr:transposase IS4 [Nitzschia inconspicua]
MAKKAGIGAVCSAPLSCMRPSQIIHSQTKYPNGGGKGRIEGLVALRKETKLLNRKLQVCIVFRHDDFPNEEIYCHERFCKVEQEGPANQFFGDVVVVDEEEEQEIPTEIPTEVRNTGVVRWNDIELLRNQGYDVDDDNEPAPENIPLDGEILNDEQTWGWNGIYQRKTCVDSQSTKPKLISLTDCESKSMTILSLFLYFFPLEYLNEVLLGELNKNLAKEKVTNIEQGEFLRFLGLWFYMSSFKGVTRSEFWSEEDINPFSGALVRFHKWMSEQRFETILTCLRYTNHPAPSYKDKFHGVRQLIDAWNDNMLNTFRPSWVSCLDKSMSPWTSRWTCPGWIFVPGKQNPMGNEYLSVCCGVSKIMWRIELVEGKDAPQQTLSPTDTDTGKTVSLLLRMLTPLRGRGMVILLNSCFCVLKGLIELRKIGIFASAVIKKKRFWPKHVPGDMMDEHMSTKQVGDVDSLKGKLDGVSYDLFCMKDTNDTIKLMSTYGSLVPSQDATENVRYVDGEMKHFKYTEPFENHNRYGHAVDHHNNIRHSDISLEETWATDRWEDRVFAFILAITEVNAYLAMRYFVGQCGDKAPMTFLEFRRQLAKALIHNNHLVETEEANNDEKQDRTLHQSKKSKTTDHGKETAPPHARMYDGLNWVYGAKDPYQRYTCKTPGCKKLVRTYCSCRMGYWMCGSCYVDHRIEVASG